MDREWSEKLVCAVICGVDPFAGETVRFILVPSFKVALRVMVARPLAMAIGAMWCQWRPSHRHERNANAGKYLTVVGTYLGS